MSDYLDAMRDQMFGIVLDGYQQTFEAFRLRSIFQCQGQVFGRSFRDGLGICKKTKQFSKGLMYTSEYIYFALF